MEDSLRSLRDTAPSSMTLFGALYVSSKTLISSSGSTWNTWRLVLIFWSLPLISGSYGPDVDLDKLKDFHRRRLQVLVEAGPDLLAFETIPNKIEAQACVELLEEQNIEVPSWICFSSVDGENAPSGERFKECLDIINKSNKVQAVGINCAPPHFIEALICKFKELTKKAIVVYPNSGEVWDGRAKRWLPSKCFDDDKFKLFASRWRDAGAKLIGGCCRTTPSTTQAISNVLKERS
ncbi:hypothetical protein I3842_15G081400 [Carya illinoinensis]|uniref:Hcy-binding domain-containing protein n=1 Tax=Carya illinoinensis TaxID=32201 RepID=A0A922AAE8_CARIL|nr:hypothetical protein I3842_15G081400 [Carya illinoinensis]